MTFGDNLTQISLHYGYVRIYIYIYSQNLIANTLLLKTFKLQE